MPELDSIAEVAALVAVVLAASALAVGVHALARLRRLRDDQVAVLGDRGPRDLVSYVRELEGEVEQATARLEDLAADGVETARRLEGAITHFGVVRYDAYQEMSGRQSSSMALLDNHRDGIVLSSILHREQARLYVKSVAGGRSEIGLSPEEEQAIAAALGERAPDSG